MVFIEFEASRDWPTSGDCVLFRGSYIDDAFRASTHGQVQQVDGGHSATSEKSGSDWQSPTSDGNFCRSKTFDDAGVYGLATAGSKTKDCIAFISKGEIPSAKVC